MSIDEILDAFLVEQRERLSARTYRTYQEVVELFRRCMNDYGHTSLTGEHRSRWEERYETNDNAYTAMFGPEMIPAEIGQFLGWYVTRKVMPSQELARACGTVTKKLGSWLESNGHLDADANGPPWNASVPSVKRGYSLVGSTTASPWEPSAVAAAESSGGSRSMRSSLIGVKRLPPVRARET